MTAVTMKVDQAEAQAVLAELAARQNEEAVKEVKAKIESAIGSIGKNVPVLAAGLQEIERGLSANNLARDASRLERIAGAKESLSRFVSFLAKGDVVGTLKEGAVLASDINRLPCGSGGMDSGLQSAAGQIMGAIKFLGKTVDPVNLLNLPRFLAPRGAVCG